MKNAFTKFLLIGKIVMESVDPEEEELARDFKMWKKMLDNMGPLKGRVSPDCSLNLQNSIKFDMQTHNRKQLLFFFSFEAVILNVTEFSIKKIARKNRQILNIFIKTFYFKNHGTKYSKFESSLKTSPCIHP